VSQDEQISSGDIDNDGDVDILLGTLWLENTGGAWTQHTLFNTGDDPDRNLLVDMDHDGDLDAVIGYQAISTTGALAWYEQGTDPTAQWTEHLIANITGPMSVDVADLDNDGDLDVVAGEHDLNNPSSARAMAFENTDGAGTSWTPYTIHTGDEHHDGMQLVDIDNDGDLDVISVGWKNNIVVLYENTSI